MAISMLQLSRGRAESRYHQSDKASDASLRSVSDARKRHRRLRADNGHNLQKFVAASVVETQKGHNLQKFVAASVVETQKAATLVHDIYVGAVSGATAGVVVEAALYPIDTIKTRLQAAHLENNQSLFKGLYSGLVGNLVGVLPASAIFVGVYEPVKRKLLNALPEHLSSLAHLTAGMCGGATSSLIRVPTEVVKQRMQTGQFVSAQAALRQIAAKEGIQGLYAGFGSFLLRDLPFDAFQFCIYEQLKIAYAKRVERELNDPESALMGAVAGAIRGALTTPLDVIKTRLMIQGTHGQYKGIHDCVMKIIKEEGAGTLLQGLGPRILWIGIGGSIFFGALEKTKDFMEDRALSKSLTTPAGYV